MIKIEHLTKSFDGNVVIKDLNIDIAENQITCIFSPSGAGKTTLLRIMAGLEKQDNGTINGEGIISFVFQEDRLLPWLTAKQNIELVSNEDKATKLLEQVKLSQQADKYPEELSGGMCRRIALARALAYNFDTLILDEPFKGLDEELKGNMFEMLLESRSSKTIVMTSHDVMDVSTLCDRVICLSPYDFKITKDIIFDIPQQKRNQENIQKYIDQIRN